MADQPRMLDTATLRRLRRLMADIQAQNGRGVSKGDLLNLARDVRVKGTLTIDFDAARDLGQPMVILQPEERPGLTSRFETLSRRELEVAELIAKGLANKEIARRLEISIATVKDHVHRILEKTGLPSRAAVASAFVSKEYGGKT